MHDYRYFWKYIRAVMFDCYGSMQFVYYGDGYCDMCVKAIMTSYAVVSK